MKLSVVMPVFNAEKYLKESIQSILSQTYKDFEFLILNDCSTDDSLNIITEFSKADDRIKVFNFEENKKPAFIRTYAVAHASTNLIAFADADDVYLPHRFETQIKIMEANPEIDICGSWFKLFGANIDTQIIKHKLNDQQIKARFLVDSHIGFPTVIIKKEVFNTVAFDGDYFPIEDYEFLAKATQNFTFYNVQEVLVNYRWHTTNVSHTATTKITALHYKLRCLLLNRMFQTTLTYPEAKVYLDALKYNIEVSCYDLIQIFKAGETLCQYKLSNTFKTELILIVNDARTTYINEAKQLNFKTLFYIKNNCKLFYKSLSFKQKKRLFKKAFKGLF